MITLTLSDGTKIKIFKDAINAFYAARDSQADIVLRGGQIIEVMETSEEIEALLV